MMTQPGETTDYTVADHIQAIDDACGGERLFDAVLVQKRSPSAQALIRYEQENSHFVDLDGERVRQLGRRIVLADILHEDPETGYVRHHSQQLAKVLMRWYWRAGQLDTRRSKKQRVGARQSA